MEFLRAVQLLLPHVYKLVNPQSPEAQPVGSFDEQAGYENKLPVLFASLQRFMRLSETLDEQAQGQAGAGVRAVP